MPSLSLSHTLSLSGFFFSCIKNSSKYRFTLQTLHFNCILSEDQQFRYNQSIPIVLSATESDKTRLDGK